LRARWIYERIHFDKTPIDMAFIGTSHTQSGINSQLVEEALRQNGSPHHVVNFAIPHLGRDLHYVLTRELLEHRKVKTIVVEVQEAEARAPHPAFQRIAEVGDLLASPLIINTGYFENIARLPLRQSLLFLQTAQANKGEERLLFDPKAYEGPHWDDTYVIHGIPGPRLASLSAESLRAPSEKLQRAFESKQALAQKFKWPAGQPSLLVRYTNFYLYGLLELAKSRNVEIVFLYLPYFHGPVQPVDASALSSYGTILTPQEILDDPASWQNEDHLNAAGARRLSKWMGEKLGAKGPVQ
jgi:hypothetical protein